MCHKWPKPSKVVVCQPSTEQKTKKNIICRRLGRWANSFYRLYVLRCVSQPTFSQWFCFLINACSSLGSLLCLLERNTACRAKYRGIWAILLHKMMFPSESSNSVSKGTFREFRPFSVIAEIFSLRTPWTVPQFGNRWSTGTVFTLCKALCLCGRYKVQVK